MASSSSSGSKYPYPSIVNPTGFVSVKLSGDSNYPQWNMQMLSLIESQELDGFIDGTILPPPETIAVVSTEEEATVVVNDEYRLWKRSDRLLKGWILGSLGEQVIATIDVKLLTARDIWTMLQSTIGPHSQESKRKGKQKVEVEVEEIEEVTTTARQQAICYPYPSAISAADFLSMKLNGSGTNYINWLIQLLSLTKTHGLSLFITNPAPPEVINQNNEEKVLNEDYVSWRKTDLLLKGWILGSLSEDLLDMMKDLHTSRDVLLKLEETFAPANERILSSFHVEDATEGNKLKCYLPLYKAALVGDWEAAKRFFDENKGAEKAIIAPKKQTVLHVAAGTKNTYFMEKLVERLPAESLMLKMSRGRTAFSIAMLVGNTDAVKIMMQKNPNLLSIRDDQGYHPMICSFSNEKTETLQYLLSVSGDANYEGQAAIELFSFAVVVGFFDIALDLVKRCPHAVRLESVVGYMEPLIAIAGKASCFQSGMCLNFFESFIYSCVPLKCENQSDRLNNGVDIESQDNCSKFIEHVGASWIGVCQILHLKLWDAMEILVPIVKRIRRRKLEHHQAIQLVRCMCEGIKSTNDDSIYIRRTREPILRAAALGIIEVVEEIVDILPCAIWSCENNDTYILQIAVQNRSEKVFNFVHRMNGFEISFIMECVDDSGNSILHLAGKLAPLHKLNLVSGAALQMQRELQWFQEVEKFVNPLYKELSNSSGETPAMVFTREHRELVIEGEKWMKDTATSCTIAAALIITVVFAAAITVPGGNNGDTGHPIFSKSSAVAFWIFAISDAISLFTSTTSLLMFLSILTARYAEQDFLRALPTRLILGLLFLFLSITSMIVAFTTAVYLVFGGETRWIIAPFAALSCLPITSFVTLQFPLLIDVFSSTYGHGTFGKKVDHPLH